MISNCSHLKGGLHPDPTKERDSNLELFRIISMLGIIAHHYVVNSGLTSPNSPLWQNVLSGPSLFLLVLGAWGKIGINCFVLITGYFMCQSHITARKFVKLLAEVMFYNIVFYLVFLLSGYEAFSLKALIKTLMPITSIAQNFTGTYLVFFLCIPFLNILVHNMTEMQHARLLLLSSFMYIFFGTVKLLPVTMNYVSWYIVLFFIASYIRLYPKKLFDSTRFWGWMTSITVLLSAASVVACAWMGTKIGRNAPFFFVSDSNTFLAVATGLSSFLWFKNLKIRSRFINIVASTCFGVLMIHANSDTMRQWLWRDTLNNVGMYGKPMMVYHAIGSIVGIFTVCCLIDLLRIRFIEKPFLKFWDTCWDGINKSFTSFETKFSTKLKIQG